jgi:hypothetical protein
MTKSLSPIRSFLQTLDTGTLFKVNQNHTVQDILDSVGYDDEYNSGSTRCLPGSQLGFTDKLLLEAVDSAGCEIYEYLSKAAIVAQYLNSQLSQNQGKSPEEWELLYFSGYA